MTTRLVAAAIVAAFLCLLGKSMPAQGKQPAPAGEPIKIGFLVPLSGVGNVMGHNMVNGAELYLDQIHHRMGGRQVELLVENDESNPAAGVAKLRKLVQQDKVNVVGGCFFSHVAYAIAPLAEQLKVPLVIDVAAADDLTKRKRSRWVLRSGWCSSQAMLPFGEYVFKKLGYKRVATIAMDYPFGYEIVGDFQQGYQNSGGKIVQKLWAPLGFSDFSTLLKQVRPDADAIFMCTIGPACEIIPKQMKELGIKKPLIGIGTSFDEVLLPRVGNALLGSVSALPYALTLDTPDNRDFLKVYRAKYGADPSWEAMLSWTQMMFLQKATESLNGDVADSTKFLAALKNTELTDSPHGSLKLDGFGNPIEDIYIRKVEKVHGKLQNTVTATLPMMSQFWQYNPQQYMSQPAWTKDYPVCNFCTPSK